MRARSIVGLLMALAMMLAACRPADGGAGESNAANPSAPASPSSSATPDQGTDYGY